MAYTSEIEKLERRVQENPQGRFFASLADAYRKDGQVGRALEVLQTGLMIHPDYVSARVVLGRCLVDQGDDAGAEVAFTRVTELDGESVIALKALADIAERRGDFPASAKWARALLTIDPGSDEAREQLARVEQASGAPAVESEPAAPTAEMQGLVEVAAEGPVVEPSPLAREEAAPLSVAASDDPPPRRRDSIHFEPSADTAARTLELIPPVAPPEPPLPTLRLSGVETTAVEPPRDDADARPEPLAVEGFESGGPRNSGTAARAPALEGLEATRYDSDDEVERETEIEIRSGASTEYQQPDDGSELTAGGSASQFQEASAAETLTPGASRLSGVSPVYDSASELEDAPPPGVPEPEPVVTEAMALLYVSQGLASEALAVYRALLQRAPGDTRLVDKVRELEGSGTSRGAAAWLAAETGGMAVGSWIQSVLAARLPDVALPISEASPPPVEAVEPLESAAAGETHASGTPTRPAPEAVSLGAIFGDEPAAQPAEGPATGSFDDFFGGSEAPGAEPAAASPRT
ncbi:MAG: tetratricopeptide repeat protein, partial [Gemmatimonadales bacterium]